MEHDLRGQPSGRAGVVDHDCSAGCASGDGLERATRSHKPEGPGACDVESLLADRRSDDQVGDAGPSVEDPGYCREIGRHGPLDGRPVGVSPITARLPGHPLKEDIERDRHVLDVGPGSAENRPRSRGCREDGGSGEGIGDEGEGETWISPSRSLDCRMVRIDEQNPSAGVDAAFRRRHDRRRVWPTWPWITSARHRQIVPGASASMS